MTQKLTPDLTLRNGITIPGEIVARFLWGDRDKGLAWIEALPRTLENWCERWKLTLEPELPDPGVNLVIFGTSEIHGPVVIKTSPPHQEITAEIDALLAHRDPNVVNVIEAHPDVSIMLQRRITPGTTLKAEIDAGVLTELEAVDIGAELMRRYWVTPPPGAQFIDLEPWFNALYAYRDRYPTGGGPIPHRHVQLAIRQADELLGSQREAVTLHGDLHHYNILRDEHQGWTIIDPKGLAGERGYDIGTWLLNPIGFDKRPDVEQMTHQRLDRFSELLGIERYRLWQWAMAHAVLSDCWNLEGKGTADAYLHAHATAEALSNMPEASRS